MHLLALLMALFLAACAAVPARAPLEDPAAAWELRRTALVRLDAWDLRGRLALRTEAEGAHASLHWVREGERHRMNLAGPFGGGRVRVVYDDSGAELRDAAGEVYRGRSVEELLARATGWWLPLEGLNYWVLGLPAPEAPAETEIDAWGRLRTLAQRGWRIDFLEYAPVDGYELPARVFIRRLSRDDVMLEARIAIERWALRATATAP